jgi:hypothetical protein
MEKEMKTEKRRNFVAKHASVQTRNSAGAHSDKRRKAVDTWLKTVKRSELDQLI